MKKAWGIVFLSLLVIGCFCLPGYAVEPYTKTVYKNKNWKVIEAGLKGEFSVREVDSSPHYLDKGKNPKYGMTVLKVTQSGKIVFAGENIGAYFKMSKKVILQVDSGTPLPIVPETPVDAVKTIEAMTSGKQVAVTFDFGEGGTSVHTFKLDGFAAAYRLMMAAKK